MRQGLIPRTDPFEEEEEERGFNQGGGGERVYAPRADTSHRSPPFKKSLFLLFGD